MKQMKVKPIIISYLFGLLTLHVLIYSETIRGFFGFLLMSFIDNENLAVYAVPSILSVLIMLFVFKVSNKKLDYVYSIIVWIGLIASFLIVYYYGISPKETGYLWNKMDELYNKIYNVYTMPFCLLFAVTQGIAVLVYWLIRRNKKQKTQLD